MIVSAEGARLRVVTQPDHARFAGQLLALWRADGLPAHPRREAILFAAREHDNGWREADAAPTWNAAAGRPHDFVSLPEEARREIWRRGTRRFAAERPAAALLITLHALALNGGRAGDEAWDELLAELGGRRDDLLETAGVAADEADADYRFVDWSDAVSLAACRGDGDPISRRWADGPRRGRFEAENGTLCLDPFPLAGATTFELPARWVERRRYDGDADFGGTLAAARWESFAVRVAPPGPAG